MQQSQRVGSSKGNTAAGLVETSREVCAAWHNPDLYSPNLNLAMSQMPLVLCFSRDQRLLETRIAVLAKKHRVVPVSTLAEMRDLPNGTTFDLILLCHTLREEDSKGAREIVHQRWPAAKILCMTKAGESCSTQDGEAAVEGLDGPYVLLQKIDTLLHPIF